MATVVLNGFFVGLIYGLFGIGLVVVYRGSRVINFAHGETGMLSAFVFAELWLDNSLPLAVSLPAAIALGVAVACAVEHFVARPLRHESRLTTMVGTFAVASLILVAAGRRWGLYPRFVKPLVGGEGVRLLGLTIQPAQLLVLAVTLAMIAALWALYRFTSFGLRLRATALDPYAASLVGVDIDRTSRLTWALAGLIAAVSAILVAPLVAFHVFFMTALLVRGVAAALVGGLTSLGGAFTAGIAIGIAESVLAFETSISGIVEAALALFIIALLLVRPAGLVRSAY